MPGIQESEVNYDTCRISYILMVSDAIRPRIQEEGSSLEISVKSCGWEIRQRLGASASRECTAICSTSSCRQRYELYLLRKRREPTNTDAWSSMCIRELPIISMNALWIKESINETIECGHAIYVIYGCRIRCIEGYRHLSGGLEGRIRILPPLATVQINPSSNICWNE